MIVQQIILLAIATTLTEHVTITIQSGPALPLLELPPLLPSELLSHDGLP